MMRDHYDRPPKIDRSQSDSLNIEYSFGWIAASIKPVATSISQQVREKLKPFVPVTGKPHRFASKPCT
jgi:hypothetical protein